MTSPPVNRLTPNEQTHVDLQEARSHSLVNENAVREYLYGTKEQWELHDEIVKVMSADPTFAKARLPYMQRTERYKNVLRMIHRVHQLQDEHKWTTAQFRKAIGLLDETHPFTLHLIAFEPVFRAQASPELLSEYGDLIANAGIIGCYLQTELAHGSNLTSLETTATYIPETREFEIHSPTFTASKWWIGGAGKFATHGVVQAQLVLPGGKSVGPHLFFVQLRSLDDHSVLPGIQLGDIGIKALGAWSTTDNGYARFDHVRIPAKHMLSKFAHVTEEGRYVQPPHAKISYGGMLYIRASMITTAGWATAKAATIAIRYAHVRRQGNKDEHGLERQIIDYPSVHGRLLPILARAYTWLLLGRNLEKAFSTMSTRLALGDTSLLAETHATTSGLKTLVSTLTARDLETARRALGGHGFSEAAGVGRIYATYLPNATFEGDNYVLDFQVVRAAVKAYNAVAFASTQSSGRSSSLTLSPFTTFLRHLHPQQPKAKAKEDGEVDSWHDPHTSVTLLELRALSLVRDYASSTSTRGPDEEARVARAVTEAFVAAQVEGFIHDVRVRVNVEGEGNGGHVVGDLLLLYLLTTVDSALVDLLSFNLLAPSVLASPSSRSSTHHDSRTQTLKTAIRELETRLVPQSVGLADAFGFSDWELDSALGVHDGRVYEALWDRAQQDPLNAREVPDGYAEYIKPVLVRGQKLAARGAKL